MSQSEQHSNQAWQARREAAVVQGVGTLLPILGRDDTADVILDDPGISRRPAEVRVTNDGPHQVAHLRDLGSTNGTYVNGEQVDAAPLADGDRITVGRTSVIFRLARR